MSTLLIRNAEIFDGSGGPSFSGDVLARDGEILDAGRLGPACADEVLDAGGRALLPGFIDVHTHSEAALAAGGLREEAVRQGVTTEITGNCGIGAAPLSGEARRYLKLVKGILGPVPEDAPCGSFGSFLRARKAYGTNMAMLAAHSPLRAQAMGLCDVRDPDGAGRMERLLEACFEEGACGFSTGLAYYPASFCGTEELVRLARVAARHGAPFCIHQRSVRNRFFPDGLRPLEEALEAAERSGAHLQLSHFKPRAGLDLSVEELLEPVERAISRGIRVSADFYPYSSGCGYVAVCLPLRVMEGAAEDVLARISDPRNRSGLERDILEKYPGAGSWVLTHAPAHPEYVGRSCAEICRETGETVPGMLLRFLAEEELDGGYMPASHAFLEEDRSLDAGFAALLEKDYYMVGSDTLPLHMRPHPRSSGAFSRALRIAKEHGVSLSKMARRLSSYPAEVFRLSGRGVIARGARADLALLDGDWQARDVWIGGKRVLDGGRHTGVLAGTAVLPAGK